MSASNARIPDEPPFPKIILLGCRPLVPYRGIAGDGPDAYPPFHAPEPTPGEKTPKAGAKLDPALKFPSDRRCPTCKGRIGRGPCGEPRPIDRDDLDYWTTCEFCAAMAPVHERKVIAARAGLERRARAEEADRRATAELRRRRSAVLSEAQRRRLWNGYRGGLETETCDLTNLAKIGRDWLISIGQAPDWSIRLDSRGRATKAPEADDA